MYHLTKYKCYNYIILYIEILLDLEWTSCFWSFNFRIQLFLGWPLHWTFWEESSSEMFANFSCMWLWDHPPLLLFSITSCIAISLHPNRQSSVFSRIMWLFSSIPTIQSHLHFKVHSLISMQGLFCPNQQGEIKNRTFEVFKVLGPWEIICKLLGKGSGHLGGIVILPISVCSVSTRKWEQEKKAMFSYVRALATRVNS